MTEESTTNSTRSGMEERSTDGEQTTKPEDTDSDVTLIQFPLQTVWRQFDISFQQKCVNSGINIHHAYKTIIDAAILYSNDVKQTIMSCSGYYKDDNPASVSIFEEPISSGLINRNLMTTKGRTIELEGDIVGDLCNQDRCIINGVDIHFKLYPNTNAFCLLTGKRNQNYKLKVEDVYFKMCMVNVNPAVLIAQSDIIKSSPALYPYIESKIKAYNIPAGEYSVSLENMFQTWVPSELIMCMVDSKSYSGDYNSNPFNFKHNLFKLNNSLNYTN